MLCTSHLYKRNDQPLVLQEELSESLPDDDLPGLLAVHPRAEPGEVSQGALGLTHVECRLISVEC